MADAGFRLTVEGEKEFKAALQSIDQQIKINKAQIKLLTQEYNLNEDGMQTLTTKQSVLQSTYDEQAKKVAALDDKYKEMAATYGETDKRVAALKVQLLDASTAMAKTESEMQKNSAAMDAYNAAMSGSGSAAKNLKDALTEVDAKLAANKAEVDRIAQSYDKTDRSAKGYEERNAALAQQNTQLNERLETQRQKMDLLREAMKKAADVYGNNSLEVQNYRKQLAEAQTEIDKTSKTIEENTKTMNSEANPLLDTFKDLTDQIGIKLPEGFDNVIGKFGKFGEIGAQLGTAVTITKGIIKTISDASDSFSNLKENAQMLGLDTTAYQELKYALGQVGLSEKDLLEIMNPLYSKIKEADDVLGDYAKGLKNMGSATDEERKKINEMMKQWDEMGIRLYDDQGNLRDIAGVFYDLIDAYSETTTATDRIVKMQKIFGETAGKVNEVVETGGKALRGYAEAAGETGKVLDESTVQAMDNVNTALEKFNGNIKLAKDSLGALLVGWMTGNFDIVGDAWDAIKGSIKGMFTGYADGTYNHPGGYALVGERGPEILRLPTGSQVYPTGISQPMMQSARGGGDTYNITINARSVREFNDIVRIARSARQNGRMGVAE